VAQSKFTRILSELHSQFSSLTRKLIFPAYNRSPSDRIRLRLLKISTRRRCDVGFTIPDLIGFILKINTLVHPEQEAFSPVFTMPCDHVSANANAIGLKWNSGGNARGGHILLAPVEFSGGQFIFRLAEEQRLL